MEHRRSHFLVTAQSYGVRSVAAFIIALLLPAVSRAATILPSQLLSAYGFGTVQQTYTGAGQTVAIYSDSYYSGLQADVNQFSTSFMGGVSTTVDVTNSSGGTPSGTDTPSGELALDVEYAHLLAPAATIMVIDGATQTSAATYASTHGASVFSTSYSSYETNYTSAQVLSYDAIYQTAISKGMAIFAAAGDSSHVDYSSSSPYVVGVAATNLTVTGSGAYSSESAWSSSGGGQSTLESEPSYQSMYVTNVQSNGMRMTPDVSIVGGASSPVPVILSGAEQYDAGSSVATPIWAGYLALIDQARVAHGYTTLSSTDVLTMLYKSLANNTTYSSIFHDITSGSDPTSGFSATTGYDELTGLGSPQAVNMLNDLDTPEPTSIVFLAFPAAMMLRRRRDHQK